MLPMLADPFIDVMVPDILHERVGICMDQVVVALEVLVYDLVAKLHHVQFA